MQFITLKESLKNKIYPIYLLQGNDSFSLKRGVEILKTSLISMPEVNYIHLQGEELQAEKLQDFILSCSALPFLENRRLIVVENFHPTKKDFDKYCKSYFDNPLDSTVLVIVNSVSREQNEGGERAKGKRGELKVDFKKERNIEFVACDKLTREDILKVIGRICKRHSVEIEREAAYILIEYALNDMLRIENELLKLISFVNTGGCISTQMVQEFVMQDFDFKIYELSNALARKQFAMYICIQNDLKQKGLDNLAILNILLKHYQTLVNIALLHQSSTETAQILNMNRYSVQKYQEQIQMLGTKKLFSQYQIFVRAINACKTGQISQERVLTQAIAKIFYQ